MPRSRRRACRHWRSTHPGRLAWRPAPASQAGDPCKGAVHLNRALPCCFLLRPASDATRPDVRTLALTADFLPSETDVRPGWSFGGQVANPPCELRYRAVKFRPGWGAGGVAQKADLQADLEGSIVALRSRAVRSLSRFLMAGSIFAQMSQQTSTSTPRLTDTARDASTPAPTRTRIIAVPMTLWVR